MRRSGFKRVVLYATVGISLLLVLVGLLFTAEQRRTRAETGAVLSALFSEEVLHDVDKWGAGRTIEIVIQRNPSCHMCSVDGSGFDNQTWFGQSLVLKKRSLSGAWFAQSSSMTRASFLVNSIFSSDLLTDVALPSRSRARFVSPNDLGPDQFQLKFPNNIGFFVVSNVGLNLNKTEALLYIDHFCGGLCGAGEYVLMRKVDGVWHVADRHRTWVS
jgi:hypothetical protein